MSGSTTIHTLCRAAFRTHLLAFYSATSIATCDVSGTSIIRAAGHWADSGFVVGDIVTVKVGARAPVYRKITALADEIMTVNSSIPSASAQTVEVTAGLPEGRSWEGVDYKPVTGTPFLQETMRAVSSEPAGVGSRSLERHTILHSVALFFPSGEGPGPIERLAGAIRDHFRAGTRLNINGSDAICMNSRLGPMYIDNGWIVLPVMVTVVAYST